MDTGWEDEEVEDEDEDAVYCGEEDGQEVHSEDASQRSDEPVSRMMLNDWGLRCVSDQHQRQYNAPTGYQH